jgi:predicted PurR-regulated permease PerM
MIRRLASVGGVEMSTEQDTDVIRTIVSQDLLDVLVRVGLIGILLVMSFRIFSPFLSILLWALVLAVSLYPVHLKLVGKMGGRQGASATVIVIVGMLLIGTPTIALGSLFAGYIHETYQAFATNSVTVNPPRPEVAEWPIIGERMYAAWSAAASDMPAFLEELQPQLGVLTARALSTAASTMGDVLLFLGALIIAGIMMAFGQSGSDAMGRILSRLSGPENGPRLHNLTTATIRSVATGVIGVAFIQALLLGVGFAFAGIPAAGLLALVVMLVGIVQLPALLVTLPVIAYLWWGGDASTTSNVIWTIYLLVAGMADNVLKPLLLGRGVDAPMPVILIGALGGMVSAGIVGLFVGAVILAVGYQLFMDWVNGGAGAETSPEGSAAEQEGGTVPEPRA